MVLGPSLLCGREKPRWETGLQGRTAQKRTSGFSFSSGHAEQAYSSSLLHSRHETERAASRLMLTSQI